MDFLSNALTKMMSSVGQRDIQKGAAGKTRETDFYLFHFDFHLILKYNDILSFTNFILVKSSKYLIELQNHLFLLSIVIEICFEYTYYRKQKKFAKVMF